LIGAWLMSLSILLTKPIRACKNIAKKSNLKKRHQSRNQKNAGTH